MTETERIGVSSEQSHGLSELVASADTAQGYWQMGILWTPLVSTDQTAGQYSLMEQLMPHSAGPPPHVHDHGDEVFYVLDGEMVLQLGDEVVVGTTGQSVRIPAGTTHAFVVTSESARVLNFYVPAGLDLQVAMLGTPATGPILPPEGAERHPTPEQNEAFAQRLHDLATQTMANEDDRLAQYRSDDTDRPMP